MINKMLFIAAFLGIAAAGLSAEGNHEPRYFEGTRIQHDFSIEYDYSPEQLFPLMCPVREYDWMSSWKGTIVYTESGYAEKYVVFYHKVPFPLHNKKAYWTATQYDPDRFLQWCITVPDLCIVVIDGKLNPLPGGRTRIDYQYRITGLSKTGNKAIKEKFSLENLLAEINQAKKEMEYYLKTGTMLEKDFESTMFK